MRVGTVKDRQPLAMREPGLGKRADQLGQVGWREDWLWAWLQGSQIQHRMLDSSFAARRYQLRQRGFARGKVEMALGSKPNKLTGADDLQFLWHKNSGVRVVPVALAAGRCRTDTALACCVA